MTTDHSYPAHYSISGALILANTLASCLLGAPLRLVVIRVVGHLGGGSRG